MPRECACSIMRSIGQIVPSAFEFAARVDRRDHQLGAGLFTDQLPGHDIRMVLEVRNDDFVPTLQSRTAETLRHEIYRGCRAARQHDLAARIRIDERGNLVPRAFKRFGRAAAEFVDAAMHVGVIVPLVIRHRVDHGGRLLCRRRAVQVYERLLVDRLVERREVRPPARCARYGRGCVHPEISSSDWIRSCSRASMRFDTAFLAASTGTLETSPAANAWVSTCLAWRLSRPRERR